MGADGKWPEGVGILAMEVYFPASFVKQSELEIHNGVSAGKYTIGLGQETMAFCTDLEDVISMGLTVVQNLLERTNTSPQSIGRLDVGSETIMDKSKSTKTALMQLFHASGNTDIEGVDSLNACYGGTAALLNALNWVEGSAWDGRLALVVATDSAVYAEGPARPTGGAGAVAILVGPDAPLAVERRLTSSFMTHVYDFYKPNMDSEYPVVDGKLSQTCYLQALDECYNGLCRKHEGLTGSSFSLEDADYAVFHAPYNKLVQKSFARLFYCDFLRGVSSPGVPSEALRALGPLSRDESYASRELEKLLVDASKAAYAAKVSPGTWLPRQTGNMYTASVWAGLASLLDRTGGGALEGKRVLVFSYGSGCASSMLAFRGRVPVGGGGATLAEVAGGLQLEKMLASRVEMTPEDYSKNLHHMESCYGGKDFKPTNSVDTVRPGTFHLVEVDPLYRRHYSRAPLEGKSQVGQEEVVEEVVLANGA